MAGKDNQSTLRQSDNGSNAALTVAFKDITRRYLNCKLEKEELAQRKCKMNLELQQCIATNQILERKIDQLQNTLQTKTAAYNNLETLYKQTRTNEDSLIKHCEETDRLFEIERKKVQIYEKENRELQNKQKQLTISVNQLTEHKKELEQKLNKEKNISDYLRSQNKKQKQQVFLSFDSTKMTDYLSFQASQNNTIYSHANELSFSEKNFASLEEGGNKAMKYPNNETTSTLMTYIKRLLGLIKILKLSLTNNSELLKTIIQERLQNDVYLKKKRKLYSNNINEGIYGVLLQQKNLKLADAISGETVSRDIPRGINIGNNGTLSNWKQHALEKNSKINDVVSPRENINISKQHDIANVDLRAVSLKPPAAIQNIPNEFYEINLPPSLLHSVRLQQINTSLDSKPLRIPPLYAQHSITMDSSELPNENMKNKEEAKVRKNSDVSITPSCPVNTNEKELWYLNEQLSRCPTKGNNYRDNFLVNGMNNVSLQNVRDFVRIDDHVIQQQLGLLPEIPRITGVPRSPNGDVTQNLELLPEMLRVTDGGSILSQDEDFV